MCPKLPEFSECLISGFVSSSIYETILLFWTRHDACKELLINASNRFFHFSQFNIVFRLLVVQYLSHSNASQTKLRVRIWNVWAFIVHEHCCLVHNKHTKGYIYSWYIYLTIYRN